MYTDFEICQAKYFSASHLYKLVIISYYFLRKIFDLTCARLEEKREAGVSFLELKRINSFLWGNFLNLTLLRMGVRFRNFEA